METGLTSAGVTAVVWLLIAVMAVALISKYIRLPYTIALVIAGLGIALAQLNFRIGLTPDIILFIFLPALLFESAYHLRFSDLRENLRPITLLAVPGVILTAVCVAAFVYYAVGVSWETAFLFGAIMSATDPVSVIAVFRQIGAPRRLCVILEGESLFNDGTALVLFRIVLGIVLLREAGGVTFAIEQFLFVVMGGIALGGLVGYGVSKILSRIDDYLVETAMTMVVAYGTYLLGERVHVSGVIAVVVAALIVGNYGHATAMSPTTRVAVSSTWEFIGFLANSLIFLLIGLELNIEKLGQFWVPIVLAIAAVLLVRTVVVVATSWVLLYIHRPLPYRWQSVLVWGGLRGALALAMALSLPLTVASGQPFPDRDLLQVTTFGVILFSLLVQGLTMQSLLRRLGLVQARAGAQDELETIGVRKAMSAAALSEVDRLTQIGQLSADMAAELRHGYQNQINNLDTALQDLHLQAEDLRREHLRSVKRRLLQVKKSVVRQRYNEGAVSEDSMRGLLTELDAQIHALDEAQEISLDPETPIEVYPSYIPDTEAEQEQAPSIEPLAR